MPNINQKHTMSDLEQKNLYIC